MARKQKRYNEMIYSKKTEKGVRKRIGVDEIRKADEILQKYRMGKANLDKRIIDNEQWYKVMHWEQLREKDDKEFTNPTSAWLFNSLINKHADAMDNYPEVVVLPREASDRTDAICLTSVINVVMDQNEYEQVYSDKWWYKLKAGCAAEGVFWNPNKNNGLGDIDVRNIDILNLFWKPGIKNLEESPNVFHLQLVDNETLQEDYPELKDKTTKTPANEVGSYVYDDQVDTSDMSVVVDWYYKKKIDGIMTLQYCKYVDDVVLYASENDPIIRSEGFYRHGLYPFVFDVMFPEEGTPAGFGYLDIMKDPQLYIDKLSGTILDNADWNSRPRFFKRGDDGINEAELRDRNKQIVHVEGSLDDNNIRPMTASQMPSTAFNTLQMKIEELKETSGNRDFSQGGTSSGVSAASAIAALQEAGSKLARDANKASYRAFSNVATRVLELIRQFYDESRCFRITKPNGDTAFLQYDNSTIKGEPQGNDFGLDLGIRVPIFDLKIKAQKKNAFSTISQNQMAQTFFQMGFFNPQLADQALACLDMMDFEGKDSLMQKISNNNQTYIMMQQMQQKMVQMAAMLDHATGGNEGAQMIGAGMEQNVATSQPQSEGVPNANNPLGRAAQSFNNTTANTARNKAANVANPK